MKKKYNKWNKNSSKIYPFSNLTDSLNLEFFLNLKGTEDNSNLTKGQQIVQKFIRETTEMMQISVSELLEMINILD
jgi:hypothetical protein